MSQRLLAIPGIFCLLLAAGCGGESSSMTGVSPNSPASDQITADNPAASAELTQVSFHVPQMT